MKYNSYKKLHKKVSRDTALHAAPWWLSPQPSICEKPLGKQSETPISPPKAQISPGPQSAPEMFPIGFSFCQFHSANERNWQNIGESEYQYLTGPRITPEPCPWCRGRYTHSRMCNELRASWQPKVPFGKHKGKPLSVVPRDYLQWLGCCDSISTELRESIKERLGG